MKSNNTDLKRNQGVKISEKQLITSMYEKRQERKDQYWCIS